MANLIEKGRQPAASAMAPAPLPEVSQPLQPDAGGVVYADGTAMTPAERAWQNERELKPLTYGKRPGQAGASAAGGASPSPAAPKLDPFYEQLAAKQRAEAEATIAPAVPRIRRRTSQPMPPAGAEPPRPAAAVDADPIDDTAPADSEAPPPLTDEDRRRWPAASDTDTPARGQMRVTLPVGKEITGGFTDGAGLQYFSLNGLELFALVETLMDELHARAKDDLRFNEALCYPQLTARVVIEIKGFVSDNDFVIERRLPPTAPAATKTPIELARQVADEVAFVLIAERRETDDAGESVTPPDAIRDELGLVKPRKRAIVGAGGQRSFVDLVP